VAKNQKEEKKVRVKLNKWFYNKKVIKEALKDFTDVSPGKIINGVIEIELQPKEKNYKLKEEFCNYVLGLMKNKNLV